MKYFGTDGFRGKANHELTVEYAMKIGQFMAWYFGNKKKDGQVRCVIGKDTRLSSYMIEYAISSGLASAGADAHLMHVTTTPSVAFITRSENFDFGIMITASHNPYYDNGIKIIDENGYKISEDILEECEKYMDGEFEIDFASIEPGRIVDYLQGRNKYMSFLASTCSEFFRGYRIGLDCANGASHMIAKTVFDMLGAKTYVINNEPDGKNINVNCGSTHIDNLRKFVVDHNLDAGFAFDGDADRCLAVDEQGNLIDGDGIMYIGAKYLKEIGQLKDNKVVVTVMSNLGLMNALAENNMSAVVTPVGDKYISQELMENKYGIGGEQSGHIIFNKYSTTGDGILTAVVMTSIFVSKKCPFS
ncbi:MAG: phosphoglucosamine mutase, partial [Lachnospiraceae bacterium]|nr:phosphoglucosamine mutase [Lachnospiraceae bacterium]